MRPFVGLATAFVLLLAQASDLHAQESALVNWALTSNQQPSATAGHVTGYAAGGTMAVRDYSGTLTNGSGGPLGADFQRWWLDADWPDDATHDPGRYIQFAVTPDPGVTFVADSLSLYLNAGGTGNMMASLFYDTDSTFAGATPLETNSPVSRDELMRRAYAIDAEVGQGEILYIRIYPWLPGGSTNSGKYVFVQDVTVTGATDVVPTAASATWPLHAEAAGAARTIGNVTAENQSVTGEYVVRDYAGSDGSQRVYAAGDGLGYWPPETSENPNRYAQFAMGPKDGVTFEADSISMHLGNSGGSDDVRASIYYSVDDFATTVRLDSGLALPNSALTRYTYDIQETLEQGAQISVRVYPWLQGGRESGKYFNIKDVVVSGTAIGTVAADPPTVSTTPVTRISTTSASTGGTVTSDGGAPVLERGVVFGTSANPTTEDNRTSDGEGAGTFTSELTGLSTGTTYYVRAYATNSSGTSYGTEMSFTTLSQLSPPDVRTSSVWDVLATRATSGGEVTFDGGLEVTERGLVWNETGNPTTADEKSASGSGLGTYLVTMAGLTPETTYYVRAYAVNAEGTAYGEEVSFTTSRPAPPIDITVAQDGSGDYTTVQAAFDAVPEEYNGPITILVKKGVYDEKILLEEDQINVTLVGEDRDSTILTHDDYSGKVVDGTTLGTSTSYSVAIDADDFVARDITFQNTATQAQAVALRVNGDRMAFYNVRMLGFQDTYYTWGYGRIYHKDCYIEGTTDFIFGRSIAVFDNCTIHSKRNSTITAASTEPNFNVGYVFRNATLTADEHIDDVELGRPWRPYARTVFMNSELGEHIAPHGWREWAGTNNHLTAYYAEYANTGPGYVPSERVSWSHQLTAEEASKYTLENIFAKTSVDPAYPADWMPSEVATSIDRDETGSAEMPRTFELHQNYPNPFNPSTTIRYEVPAAAHVRLDVYNVLGRHQTTLVDRYVAVGSHAVTFEAIDLSSGVYFYTLRTDDVLMSRKMLLLR